MAIEENIKQKLDGLLKDHLISLREYRIYTLFISKRSPDELKRLILEQASGDIGSMIGCEIVKQTDKFLLTAAKFYWEQVLASFEERYFSAHSEVVDGVKDFLEALEKPVVLEISAIFEPELIRIIRDFYAHGCPKTDKISIK